MNRRHSYSVWGLCIVLLGIPACVPPGQAIPPTPVSQPISMEVAVAGTAQAAQQQTEQAKPVFPTETAAATATATAAEVISTYGTSLVKLTDGSTQFRDHRAGVQIIFPPNWLALRTGEPEYYAAWEKEGIQNPDIMEGIVAIQNLDLNVFRMTAYDLHPEHVMYRALPRINVVFVERDTRTLKAVMVDEKQAIESSIQKDHAFVSSDFQETSTGLPIMIFQAEWRSSSYDNVEYMTHYRGVFFSTPAGLVVIDLFVPREERDILAPECDQIVESITLLDP